MNVSLIPELEFAVRQKVESGLYESSSEVIQEALRRSLKQDEENDRLKREAAIGYAQLEARETVRVNSRAEFIALARGES